MGQYRNPILTGTHPDPSVCRVGDEYFLVTSTFEYVPGIPVFRSTDLVTWTLVGHAIAEVGGPGQLDLATVPSSGGLYAATIRHHDGVFYVVTTLVHGTGRTGTFLVTARDAAGPWSDPIWIDEATGIDPSLFFDDDGRAWMTGTRLAEPGLWHDQTEVWLREFDPVTCALVGEEFVIWHGALEGAVWAEGPHLYRVEGRYYLLAAEGGTERGHAVSVAASDTITGPYVGHPGNPVLTHRHLGRDYPLVGVGHADLVEAVDGGWWAVLLASRPYGGGDFANLGRETHLVPVEWQDGWPVFAPGRGVVAEAFTAPAGAAAQPSDGLLQRDDFDGRDLALEWTGVRGSPKSFTSLDARPGWLRLTPTGCGLADIGTPAFIGRRQQHRRATLTAVVDANRTAAAGLAVRQSEDAHITIAVERAAAGARVVARSRFGGADSVLGELAVAPGPVTLRIRATDQRYALEALVAGAWASVGAADGSALSSSVAGGFLGIWMGAFATGDRASTHVDIDWIEYLGGDSPNSISATA